jgi:hypothetical protein
VETELFEKLKKESQEEGISISELSRQKLRESSRLAKIEFMLEKLINDRKIYKVVHINNSIK